MHDACADSEHELESLDASKAYIIGGIVDRNRHKNLCLNKAKEQGIATARLPIGNHLKMLGSSILTVNQVSASEAACPCNKSGLPACGAGPRLGRFKACH